MPDDHVRVYLESPYGAADDDTIRRNIRYLRACMRDSLLRGEAPFASHAMYTQPGVLRDEIPAERDHGIFAGFAFRPMCAYTVVYTDLGISRGMELGIKAANALHLVEYRKLGEGWPFTHACDIGINNQAGRCW